MPDETRPGLHQLRNQSSIRVSHTGGRTPSVWAVFHCPLCIRSWTLGLKQALVRNVVVPSGSAASSPVSIGTHHDTRLWYSTADSSTETEVRKYWWKINVFCFLLGFSASLVKASKGLCLWYYSDRKLFMLKKRYRLYNICICMSYFIQIWLLVF